MGRWLSKLKNEISVDLEPTKPTKPQKMTLVSLVSSESRVFKKNKSGRWLSQIKPKNTLVSLVSSEPAQIEKINQPKVWKLKIRTSDGKSINSMTMIDPDRMSEVECKNHLARQFGIERVISFEEKYN